MNRQIEDYLRTSGVRYFRGHHDDEYFYLVDFVVGALRGHLNVHLEVCGPDRDTVAVSITADRYYPAELRERLDELVARFNAADPVAPAAVHDSCDPSLVGLSVTGVSRPAGIDELTTFVDTAVRGAVSLFGGAMSLVAPGQSRPDLLRDAG